MKKEILAFLGVAILAGSITQAKAQTGYVVDAKVTYKAIPFRLNEVRLLDSKFKNAMEKDATWLLMLEPDRLLSRFRAYSGLKPKGEIYGGWEEKGVSGHSLGHYLTAVSMMYAASGDVRFKERADYIVKELLECQKAKGTGYVGAIPDGDKIFDEVASGNINSKGFDLNGGWVPWYTEHKVLAGLIDAYTYTGNKDAKKVATDFSDWIATKFSNLNRDQFQKMLACEHGGMNEALANVYAITGDEKYLDLSRKFFHEQVLDPLANKKDELAGLHANTQIPKVIGTARDYELTGDKQMHTISQFFWDAVVHNHSYVIGGNSNYEHFAKPGQFADQLSSNTTETCNSYNMLKLTQHLYKLDPSSTYMDYFERVIYNHILPSQNPETGMVLYYFPLKSGERKVFGTPDSSFWCCTGTGMENHVKYGEDIYFKANDGGLYVNLFIPSQLNWKDNGFCLKQEGNFPESDKVTFTVTDGKFKNNIYLRVPAWTNNATLTVNGKRLNAQLKAGSYFTLSRDWKKGDVLEYSMPMSIHKESLPDDKNKVALLYGPVVLAGKLGDSSIKNEDIPVLVNNNTEAKDWIQFANQKTLTFTTKGNQSSKQTTLVPLYDIVGDRYMVYWDKFSSEEWKQKQVVYQAELKKQEELDARTLDILRTGEMQPERDHALKGENTFTGAYNDGNWRDARDGGYFSFTMDTKGEKNAELWCTYFGSDGGNRKFSVLVDGEVIAKESLEAKKPSEFFTQKYAIPTRLLKNKKQVVVKFLADKDNTAGGLFGVRLVKP